MPPLTPAPASSDRERLGVMVPALGAGAVGPGGAAELGADGHQRLAQEPALLQVADQGRDGAVDAGGLGAMVLHVAVGVPVVVRARVDQLDDPHAPLDQPAGDQALVGERGSCRRRPLRRATGSPPSRRVTSSTSGASRIMPRAMSKRGDPGRAGRRRLAGPGHGPG